LLLFFFINLILYYWFFRNNGSLKFISGSLAGVTSQTLTYPLDLARARMAVSTKNDYKSLGDVKYLILNGFCWCSYIIYLVRNILEYNRQN